MARIRNDNIYLEPFQRLSFRDDAGDEAAAMYYDGDQLVLMGITISGAQGPPGPAGTGIPGYYIGDEDQNTQVFIDNNAIRLITGSVAHMNVSPGGNILIGHDDISTVYGKVNIDHTGNNNLVLDNIDTTTNGPGVVFRKARGYRGGGLETSVGVGDYIGSLSWWGFGTGPETEARAWLPAFAIHVQATSGMNATTMPAQMTFKASPDNWDNAIDVMTLSANGMALSSGPAVNYITTEIQSGDFNGLPTGAAVYNAINDVGIEISNIYATFSGIDLKMSRIFDPTYSGTEIRIVDDNIEFLSQGTKIAGFNEEGLFELGPEGYGINSWYDGDLRLEASSIKVPTAAAVKAYVDNYGGGSSSRLTGNRLITESGLSSLTIDDESWTGNMVGNQLLKFWRKHHTYGSMFGKTTDHLWFGDKINYPPSSFLGWNSADSGIPAFLFHSKGGSRLYLYNQKNYGADTNPIAQIPGITIDRRECVSGDSYGDINFSGGVTLQARCGNTLGLPSTENELAINLGTYAVYEGQILATGTNPGGTTYGGSYPGGILRLNCKLHFGNNRIYGSEGGGYGDLAEYTTEAIADWGSYGNNGWVHRIACCHYQGNRDNVGSKFDDPPEAFIGTGDDDHCLVTGKYVHTLVAMTTAAWDLHSQGPIISNKWDPNRPTWNFVEHSVICNTGVSITYGYETPMEKWVHFYAPQNDGFGQNRHKAAAVFHSEYAGSGNKIILESCGVPTSLTEAQHGWQATAPEFCFFRSRGTGYVPYGDGTSAGLGEGANPSDVTNWYRGTNPVKIGDNLGQITWIGHCQNNSVEKSNPCDYPDHYNTAAAIRVFADQVTDSICKANMVFYCYGSGGGGLVEDMKRSMTLAHHGSVYIGPSTHISSGYLGVPGRFNVESKAFTKQHLSGDIIISKASQPYGTSGVASIMFAGGWNGGDGNGLTSSIGDVLNRSGANQVINGNAGNYPLARIDAAQEDPEDLLCDAGRLSFLIHKTTSLVFDEVIRIHGSGKVVVGSDLVGQTAHMANPQSLFNIAQISDDYRGGLALTSTTGLTNCIFTDSAGKLSINAGTLWLNSANGKIDVGNTVNNTSSPYILRTNGNIVPAITNLYNLGSSTLKWNDIWATNSIIQTSDRNEKEEIITETLGLDFVKNMKPVSFKRTGGTRRHHGLVAQDIEALISKFGISTNDTAFFIKDPGGTYGLRYEELIGILIKAIQELAAKVED